MSTSEESNIVNDGVCTSVVVDYLIIMVWEILVEYGGNVNVKCV